MKLKKVNLCVTLFHQKTVNFSSAVSMLNLSWRNVVSCSFTIHSIHRSAVSANTTHETHRVNVIVVEVGMESGCQNLSFRKALISGGFRWKGSAGRQREADEGTKMACVQRAGWAKAKHAEAAHLKTEEGKANPCATRCVSKACSCVEDDFTGLQVERQDDTETQHLQGIYTWPQN